MLLQVYDTFHQLLAGKEWKTSPSSTHEQIFSMGDDLETFQARATFENPIYREHDVQHVVLH